MPMMMDDELDDLFGDRQLGDITDLPNLPAPQKGLIQRIDDLRISGCSHDGDDDRRIAPAHDGHTLKHLSWNHTGMELAVIDTRGNISVSSLVTSVNRCSVIRRCVLGAEDDLSVPVGSMWLNQDRALVLPGVATKNLNGQWAFTRTRCKQAGPHNPHIIGEQSSKNKAAFAVVTRAGTIRLLYQGPDGGRWLEMKANLESILTAKDVLTRAAICAEPESSMIVATHSLCRRIQVHRVSIDWSTQSFVITHLKTIMESSPVNNNLDISGLPLDSPRPESKLYHLELASPVPAPDVRKQEPQPLVLLAFFCNTASTDKEQPVEVDHSTFIVRWELCNIKPSLHPSFSQLALKRPNGTKTVDLQPEVTFKRLQDVRINKVVVALRELHLAKTLVLCYSDGSVEFRSRSTLELLPRDDADRVSSMAQVGLEYPPGDSYLHAVLSPSACALVSLDEESTARLKVMQMPHPSGGNLSEKGIEAVAEACLMQFNMCMGLGNYHDDLSAVMQSFQTQYLRDRPTEAQGFIQTFLGDLYRISQLNADYSGDIKIEQFLKNLMHQKALSMQHSLGYQGEQQHRTLPSKVAFATLQLRWAALTLLMGLKSNAPGTVPSPEAEKKTIRSCFGIFEWTLSLLNYIMDELFTLVEDVEGAIEYHSVEARIRALNTPALALLFVSQSRLLIKYHLVRFRSINAEAIQSRPQNPTWRESAAIFTKSPVPVHLFEKVVADIETSIRDVYESNQIPDAERKEIEKKMLISGSVPSELWPAIESLLTKTLPSVRGDINRAGLYFHDVSWIGLSDDKASDQWRREHRLDIVRKTVMPKQAKIKRCTRCCSVMEDSAPQKGATSWVINLWRTCVCGNWWMELEEKEGKMGDSLR
ncbi:MAG: hypothetical protein Q9169_003421 [Polycauliona sp. 2 TL-2023]